MSDAYLNPLSQPLDYVPDPPSRQPDVIEATGIAQWADDSNEPTIPEIELRVQKALRSVRDLSGTFHRRIELERLLDALRGLSGDVEERIAHLR